jgi:TRAP-type C4-dicarboxylate transport system permease small subunit
MAQETIENTWICKILLIVGGVSIISLMMLIVGNIFFRLAGFIIPGSYELAEQIIPVIGGAAIVGATLYGAHVSVDLLTSRFTPITKLYVSVFVGVLGACYWIVMGFAAAFTALRNSGLGETTELLGLSVPPFRWLWVAVSIYVAIHLLVNVVHTLKRHN